MALWAVSSRVAVLGRPLAHVRRAAAASATTTRWASEWGGAGSTGAKRRRAKLPVNLGINFVPQQASLETSFLFAAPVPF